MTNYEFYKNEIEKLTRMGLRIAIEEDTKEICTCADIHCKIGL